MHTGCIVLEAHRQAGIACALQGHAGFSYMKSSTANVIGFGKASVLPLPDCPVFMSSHWYGIADEEASEQLDFDWELLTRASAELLLCWHT